MFEQAIQSLADLISSYPWVSEVAGILPLSALIDFVDVPQKLHIHQLVSAVPHWSWPVTPAGSRLLLEDAPTQQECALDRFGRSIVLEGLDGCFGARYYVMNPETVRLIIESLPVVSVENRHDNMNMEKSALRIQNLQVLFVSRNPPPSNNNSTGPDGEHDGVHGPRSRCWWRYFSSWPSIHPSLSYQLTSLLGWVALLGCLAAAIIFQLHITTAFLVLMPATGLCVTALYPGSPRMLLRASWPGEPMRMVVVAEHMNSADWIVFYGPSAAVNSLVNTPLEPTSSVTIGPKRFWILRTLLRILVLGQWALAVGAAATKDWNSFFISFWIFFCNFTHGYVIPPTKQAGAWASAPGCANLRIKRVAATVSTRRALLSTLVALNPDSFKGEADRAEFPSGSTRWIDPILPTGHSRTEWEKAMRKALQELAPDGWEKHDFEGLDRILQPEMQKKLCKVETEVSNIGPPADIVVRNLPALSETWNEEYMKDSYYWNRYVSEGVYMAASIREKGKLPRPAKKVVFGNSVV